jgi:hypothetical protein
MFAEEILLNIDSTLELLIKNAETLREANVEELTESEINAFQKTQESLLRKFLFMDQMLETKRKKQRVPDKRSSTYKIQRKFAHFEKLKAQTNETICEARKKQPILAKRKRKRYLYPSKFKSWLRAHQWG